MENYDKKVLIVGGEELKLEIIIAMNLNLFRRSIGTFCCFETGGKRSQEHWNSRGDIDLYFRWTFELDVLMNKMYIQVAFFFWLCFVSRQMTELVEEWIVSSMEMGFLNWVHSGSMGEVIVHCGNLSMTTRFPVCFLVKQMIIPYFYFFLQLPTMRVGTVMGYFTYQEAMLFQKSY